MVLVEKQQIIWQKKTDLAIAIGTKLADFTTGSWANFENPNFKLVSINAARFDANKHMAQALVGDAKVSLSELSLGLGSWKAEDSWNKKAQMELKVGMNMLIKKVVQQTKNYLVMLTLLGQFIEILIHQI